MENIPPNRKALEEALCLSGEILKNLELNEISLTNTALKACRLARLLNHFTIQRIMELEASGYPSSPSGVAPDIYQLAKIANREFSDKNHKTGLVENYVYLESIEVLEYQTKFAEKALDAAKDRDASNWYERQEIRNNASKSVKRLSSRRALIHAYVLRTHYELKFSGIAGDIFSRVRERVDSAIGDVVPDAINKLSAAYDNLLSDNPENWSNAVHSCRRILQDLADAIFPPAEDRIDQSESKQKSIKLGKDNYINRIIAYISDHSNSEKFNEIVGSHLNFLGDRLDSVFQATQKGSHSIIVSREEADRYVVYTYLIVGDILSLSK